MDSKAECFIDEMFSRDSDFIINESFISGTKNTRREGKEFKNLQGIYRGTQKNFKI